MPTGNVSSPNTLAPSKISNPKSVVISPAKNGFVVQMQKVSEYGFNYAVAKSLDEITPLIEEYFKAI